MDPLVQILGYLLRCLLSEWSLCLYDHEAAETIVIRHLVHFRKRFYWLDTSILGQRGRNNPSENVSDGGWGGRGTKTLRHESDRMFSTWCHNITWRFSRLHSHWRKEQLVGRATGHDVQLRPRRLLEATLFQLYSVPYLRHRPGMWRPRPAAATVGIQT